MWVTKLLISQVKNRIFCPKNSKFRPKMAFLFIFGHALLAHLVGGCGARAVSRKTTINFILHCLYMFFFYRQRLYHSPKHRFTRCLLSMMGFAVPLFDDLFVWRLNEFKDDLV